MRTVAKYQTARVSVTDEAWREFRQLAVARGRSVAGYLGRLVETELRRRRPEPSRSPTTEDEPVRAALAALGEVRGSIDDLDQIAGRLARSAVAHGASWGDVGSSLGLRAREARDAHKRTGDG